MGIVGKKAKMTSAEVKGVATNRFLICLFATLAAVLSPGAESFAASVGGGISFGGGFSFGTGGAGGGGGIGDALCTIVDWFEAGGIGAAVASLAVIFMGIAAFFGKVTWGMALTTATGIFAIFGSSSIISAVTGGAGGGCFY